MNDEYPIQTFLATSRTRPHRIQSPTSLSSSPPSAHVRKAHHHSRPIYPPRSPTAKSHLLQAHLVPVQDTGPADTPPALLTLALPPPPPPAAAPPFAALPTPTFFELCCLTCPILLGPATPLPTPA